MAGCGIYNEIDPWQRKAIFWACSVDVSEVDAKPPLSICFFDEYDVGQPFWVLYLPDCPYLESLVTSSLIAFCISGAKFLLFCLTGLKDGLMFSL